MNGAQEIPPGGSAAAEGTYEEVDVLGRPTGRQITVRAGDRLPHSPRGFGWRLAP